MEGESTIERGGKEPAPPYHLKCVVSVVAASFMNMNRCTCMYLHVQYMNNHVHRALLENTYSACQHKLPQIDSHITFEVLN